MLNLLPCKKKNLLNISLLGGVLLGAGLCASNSFANPVLGNVSSGNVTIQQTTNTTTIHQQSSQAVINWQSFNIGAGQVTHFQQPTGGVALNHIDPSQGASAIYGKLTATGQIILINPAGIYFGPHAYVNVGGLIASTATLSDSDFLKGYYDFTSNSAYAGNIVNAGQIIAASHGLIALIGSNAIQNNGLIQANLGKVVLASGGSFTMSFAGNDMISFSVNSQTLKGGITNTGTLRANGGQVMVTASVAQGVLNDVINMKGVVQANSVRTSNGEIILNGGSSGVVQVAAKISAKGKHVGTKGGNVTILGENILLESPTTIDVSGDIAGGNIQIGGSEHGAGPLPNATATVVDPGVTLNANANTNGNGGNVIVWSNNVTKMYGEISAMGGLAGGNGGFVETSSHDYLDINGATVNLTAANGNTGTWLLDPENITISTAATSGGSFNGNTTTNVFTPTAANSTILNTMIQTDLQTANVLITTGSTGTQTGDITVSAPITWATSNSLTLSAYRNINLAAGASITATGGGNLTLQADNTGTGTGTVTFTGTAPQINVTGGGVVSIFYNPTTFGTPTNYSSDVTAGTTMTAYMLINNLTNLQAVNNNLSGNYALGTNINAAAITNFVPLGNATTPFSGNFNGQNYQITNLTINTPTASNVGLFGYTAIGSTISYVSVGATINGLTYVGALVGTNNAYLTNVSASGTITTGANALDVGGLVGLNNGSIYYANSSVNVTTGTTSQNIGGLIGSNQAYLTAVYSTGNVTAGSGAVNLGGLIGINFRPIISSYSSSVINSPTATDVGGLIGNNLANIQNDYATAGVNAANSTNVGGLVGLNNAYISDTYSTSAITAAGGTDVGAVVGNNEQTVLDSYWNTDTSGLTNAVGTGSSTGMTGGCFGTTCTNSGTAQLTSRSTFNWDFASTWGILPGQSYPYLLAFNPLPPRVIAGTLPAGSGTEATLAANGVVIGTVQAGANGSFYFFEPNGTVANGSDLLVYMNGSSTTGNVVTIAPANGLSVSDLSIYANTLNVGENTTANTISNTTLATAEGSLSNSGILYTVSGGNLILNSGVNLNVTLPTTYGLSGNITATNGNLVFNGPVSISAANAVLTTTTAGDITISGNVNGNNNGLTINDAGPSTISGVMSALSSFTKGGAGDLQLTGVNTFTGPTTLNAGTLTINADTALGTAPTTATAGQLVFNGGTLEITSALLTLNANRGILLNAGGGTVQVDSGTTTYNGIIAGAGGLSKTGTGTLSLGGTNTYTGTTNILTGILEITNGHSLGTGSVVISTGAELFLNGNLTVANAMTVNGTGINSAGAIVANGTETLTGAIVVATAATVGLAASADSLSLTGALTYGSGATLARIGSGTLTLPSTGTTGGGGTTGGAGTTGSGSGGCSGNGCGGCGNNGCGNNGCGGNNNKNTNNNSQPGFGGFNNTTIDNIIIKILCAFCL